MHILYQEALTYEMTVIDWRPKRSYRGKRNMVSSSLVGLSEGEVRAWSQEEPRAAQQGDSDLKPYFNGRKLVTTNHLARRLHPTAK